MATIKDIARKAGVSQGTVSNVLNGKGNVSSKKIRMVMDAAAQLDYKINRQAKVLRTGSSNRLAAILPNIVDRCYTDFYFSFKHYAEQNGYRTYLSLSDGNQQEEKKQLEAVNAEMTAGVVVFSCVTEEQKHFYEEIGIDRQRVVFAERCPYDGCNFVGFDYELAGRSFAGICKKHHYRKVALVTESRRFSDQSVFYKGFYAGGAEDDGRIVYHLSTDMIHCYNHFLQLIRLSGELDAVFFSKQELSERFGKMVSSMTTDTPEIYSLSSLNTMPTNTRRQYELNYRLMGKTAAEMLIHPKEQKNQIVLANDGFSHWTKNYSEKKNVVLNMLTLDSPTAHIMEDLAQLYSRATGVEIRMKIQSYDNIYAELNDPEALKKYDVIRLDHTWLNGYAEKIFTSLEKLDSRISEMFDQFIPGLNPGFSTVNGTVYALPETPSAQMLFYRKDLFENTELQRLYKEAYKEELLPPQNYKSFNQIAEFFTKSVNPESPVQYGTTMTLGNSGVAATEYLTRYFSLQESLFDEQGRLLLNTDAALQAMEQLIDAKKFSSADYSDWWRDTAREFSKGETAMTVLFSNYASEMLNSHSEVIGNIGYADAPGGNALVGGGSIGVCKESRNQKEALDFIKWVCSDKVSTAMTLLGSISPCRRTYENYEVLDTFPWLALSPKAIESSHTVRTPKNQESKFDERKFLGILGEAVLRVYSGEMAAKDALSAAQFAYETKI